MKAIWIFFILLLLSCRQVWEEWTWNLGGKPESRKTWIQNENGMSQTHGLETRWHPNGVKKIEISWKWGVRSGKAKSFFPTGKLKEEMNWKQDRLSGIHRVWSPQGDLTGQYNWKNGVRQGTQRQWNPGGTLVRIMEFKDGRPHGLEHGWDHSGQKIYSRNWEKGVILGVEVPLKEPLLKAEYFHPGMVPRLCYNYYLDWSRRHVLHGELKKWSPRGVLLYSAIYRHKEKHGVETAYSEDKGLKRRTHWSNGLKNGTDTEWWTNSDSKKYEISYKNGELHGRGALYYENGMIRREFQYLMGKLEGELIERDPNGMILQISYYKAGIREGREFFHRESKSTVIKLDGRS